MQSERSHAVFAILCAFNLGWGIRGRLMLHLTLIKHDRFPTTAVMELDSSSNSNLHASPFAYNRPVVAWQTSHQSSSFILPECLSIHPSIPFRIPLLLQSSHGFICSKRGGVCIPPLPFSRFVYRPPSPSPPFVSLLSCPPHLAFTLVCRSLILLISLT